MGDRCTCRWCGREFEEGRGVGAYGTSGGDTYCGLSCYRSASNAEKQDIAERKARKAEKKAKKANGSFGKKLFKWMMIFIVLVIAFYYVSTLQ